MKYIPTSLALFGAIALAVSAPAQAAGDESSAAVAEAAQVVQNARDDMLETFGTDHLESGDFLWQGGTGDVTRVVVSLADQTVYAYAGDQLIGVATTSTAKEGYITPVGIFSVLEKNRVYHSRKYDNAPMPYAQRIDEYGIAMHGGAIPGYPASHGCIRLPTQFAAKLFRSTDIGTKVYIGGAAPIVALSRLGD
jgi:hypothetical protein